MKSTVKALGEMTLLLFYLSGSIIATRKHEFLGPPKRVAAFGRENGTPLLQGNLGW